MNKNENTAAETGELPPLPEPKYAADDLSDIFTAKQMRDYARAAIAAYLARQEQAEPVAWRITTITPEDRKPLVFFAYTEESARFTHSQYKGSTLTPLYATPVSQAPVAQAEVKIERGRVWIVKGNQSFMLAYEADHDEHENVEWYANQLRAVLSTFTPSVNPVAQAVPEGWNIRRVNVSGTHRIIIETDEQMRSITRDAEPTLFRFFSDVLAAPTITAASAPASADSKE